ncbi:hypothetical protein OAU86_03715, partial [Balneolaceae bacterium]|nr:hypothetical protein [Balneolaceae bacterium]
AGNLMPPVRLSTTAEATVFYNFEQLALRNAQVMIWELDEQSEQKESRITYEEESPGIYQPTEEHRVIPGAKYLLEVIHPDYQTSSVIVGFIRRLIRVMLVRRIKCDRNSWNDGQ